MCVFDTGTKGEKKEKDGRKDTKIEQGLSKERTNATDMEISPEDIASRLSSFELERELLE